MLTMMVALQLRGDETSFLHPARGTGTIIGAVLNDVSPRSGGYYGYGYGYGSYRYGRYDRYYGRSEEEKEG